MRGLLSREASFRGRLLFEDGLYSRGVFMYENAVIRQRTTTIAKDDISQGSISIRVP